MLRIELFAESGFEEKILVLTDPFWLHGIFPLLKQRVIPKPAKKSLVFSSVFHREVEVTSGATI